MLKKDYICTFVWMLRFADDMAMIADAEEELGVTLTKMNNSFKANTMLNVTKVKPKY